MLNTLWQTVGIVFADRPADMQEALDWFNPRGAIKELERRSQPVAPAASTDHWGAWMEYEDV
jgi:hypothetical protein